MIVPYVALCFELSSSRKSRPQKDWMHVKVTNLVNQPMKKPKSLSTQPFRPKPVSLILPKRSVPFSRYAAAAPPRAPIKIPPQRAQVAEPKATYILPIPLRFNLHY